MMFSIIVPVYKVEKYLEKCVFSLINQTFKDIEIILVDDGSPDNCPVMCDDFALSDSRIRVIHKTNGGLSDARNAGLSVARGEYVFFVDSDDYIEVTTCEKFQKFTCQNIDIIVGQALVENGNCELKHINAVEQIFEGKEYLLKALEEKKAPMAAWLNVYRRKFLIDNQLSFKLGILHEDEQFTPRAFLAANTVIVTDIAFYHYIIRSGSIMTTPDKRKNIIDIYNTCCELEEIYLKLENEQLKKYLLDSLVSKYLSIFQLGKLHRYGKTYVHKDFVKRNVFCKRTRKKVFLFCFSPRLYYYINILTKKKR